MIMLLLWSCCFQLFIFEAITEYEFVQKLTNVHYLCAGKAGNSGRSLRTFLRGNTSASTSSHNYRVFRLWMSAILTEFIGTLSVCVGPNLATRHEPSESVCLYGQAMWTAQHRDLFVRWTGMNNEIAFYFVNWLLIGRLGTRTAIFTERSYGWMDMWLACLSPAKYLLPGWIWPRAVQA